MLAVMDELSSKTFKPIQPDGYVLSCLGKEAPKIEITETESFYQDSVSHDGCEVALSEWDDLAQRGETSGEHPGGSPHHHYQDCPDQHRRGSLSRRSAEGGPGKCPSPSRTSPHRHSPVPYSPKRQNRTRSSASSAASEELSDITLSPRRQSPVPGSPHSQVERPSSLSLASGSGEEFICISYADPFSSPTITRTSEAIMAITINGSNDHSSSSDHQDVEMIPQDSREAESSSVLLDGTGIAVSSSVDCAVIRTSLNDGSSKTTLHGEASGTQQTNLWESEGGDTSEGCRDDSAVVNSSQCVGGDDDDDDHQAAVTCDTGYADVRVVGSMLNCSPKEEEVGRVESMEGENNFNMEAVSDSDSSSDDEMIDFINPYPGVEMSVEDFSDTYAVPSFCGEDVTLGAQSSSLGKCAEIRNTKQKHTSCDEGFSHEHIDKTGVTNAQAASFETSRQQSKDDLSTAQSLADNLGELSGGGAANFWAARRASCPDHHSGLSSSTLSPSSSSTDTCSSLCRHSSKTPEDFALRCVVGSPPLTFPHCQYAILVHRSLPSPYNPALPTPPIVLTPHTSYEDLHCDPVTSDPRCSPAAKSNLSNLKKRSHGENQDTSASATPGISRSRSFPKLDQSNGGQFQEPDQNWPALGQVEMEEQERDGNSCESSPKSGRPWETRRSSDNGWMNAGNMDTEDDAKPATSASLPGSPSNSRAAVMGRLRRVVERRLSGTSDTLEEAASLAGGGGSSP